MRLSCMQYVMGHSDAQITMNVYNHIAEKSHVENEMSKMNLPETIPAVVYTRSRCRKNVVKSRKSSAKASEKSL